MPLTPQLAIEHADITEFDADVVAFKYAQAFHGADGTVADLLMGKNVPAESLQPGKGKYSYLASRGAIAAQHVLFVGVPNLHNFTYPEIQKFSADILSILKREAPETRHVAITLHGVGYGLDEMESLVSSLRGFEDALNRDEVPAALQRLTIVDRNLARVTRLRNALAQRFWNSGTFAAAADNVLRFAIAFPSADTVQATPPVSDEIKQPEPHVFVSHCHADNEYCREFVGALRQNLGSQEAVWYDEHNMGWGVLMSIINSQLEITDHFIAILSPEAVASTWVNQEIAAALELLKDGQLKTFLLVPAKSSKLPPLLRGFKRVEQPNQEPYSPQEAASRVATIIRSV